MTWTDSASTDRLACGALLCPQKLFRKENEFSQTVLPKTGGDVHEMRQLEVACGMKRSFHPLAVVATECVQHEAERLDKLGIAQFLEQVWQNRPDLCQFRPPFAEQYPSRALQAARPVAAGGTCVAQAKTPRGLDRCRRRDRGEAQAAAGRP